VRAETYPDVPITSTRAPVSGFHRAGP